jgi:hypothetical protein
MVLPLLRKLMPALAVNALLALLFVGTNYIIWDAAESSANLVKLVSLSPFWVTIAFLGEWVNGQIIPAAGLPTSPIFNFPFWFFFVAMAINLVLILDSAKNSNSGTPKN